MKKNKLYIAVLIVIVITTFLTIIIKNNYNYKIDIQRVNDSTWDSYDESIKTIKANMDGITESNENFFWWTLKDFDIEDDEYEQSLNNLVASVRMCYLEYTDNGEMYTNSNPIRNYRNKDYITKKELEKLNIDVYNEQHGTCLKRFDNNSLLISNNKEIRKNFLSETNKINKFVHGELFNNKQASFNELLLRKTYEVHLIEDISEFLKDEYNRLK